MLLHSPLAVFGISPTSTVISVDDGLLRTSTGCAGPAFSLTLYVDWLKETTITKMMKTRTHYYRAPVTSIVMQ